MSISAYTTKNKQEKRKLYTCMYVQYNVLNGDNPTTWGLQFSNISVNETKNKKGEENRKER